MKLITHLRGSTLMKLITHLALLALLSGSCGGTELHTAAETGDLGRVRTIIESGEIVNSRDSNGATPLHVSAESGQIDVIKALLAAGADKNVLHEQKDMTALQVATQNGQAEVVSELLHAKAKVNARSKEHGMTALHVYVSSGVDDVSILDMLLSSGAKVNAKDFNGVAPLHLAVYTENKVAVERLAGAGANMNVRLPTLCVLPPAKSVCMRTPF